MTADADAPNSRRGHALDAYIDASVQQLLSAPPNGDNRQDTLVYLGNWHVALARILLQDPVLRPEDKIVIMNIMVSASPGAAAAFPSYRLLGEKANIRGRATIADAITVARVTRWITLCRRVRDAKGRWRGNLYALHDEPLALADTLRLDVEYLPFLNQSCNHRRQHVRRIAQGVLSTIQGDIATGHDVTESENPLERRMAAIRALQQDTPMSVDHYYSLSSAALAAVKANNQVQFLKRDDRVQILNTANAIQVQDLNLENNALNDGENNKLNEPCRNLNTVTTCSSSCINITTHCCPINSLSLRERVGVRGSKRRNLPISFIPSSCPSPEGRRDAPFSCVMSGKRFIVYNAPLQWALRFFRTGFVGQQ